MERIIEFLAILTSVGCIKIEDGALERRFSHTVDFMLDQYENTEIGGILKSSTTKFARSPLGKDKPETCYDKLGKGHCQYLKKFHTCSTHKDRMQKLCSRTCKLCQPSIPACHYTKWGCCHDEVTPAKGPYFRGCQESCSDKNGALFCYKAKRLGYCAGNFESVKKGCKKTCALCRPCVDEEPSKCLSSMVLDLCKKAKNAMMNKCRKTCGFCGAKDPCASFACPKRMKCEVNPFGIPHCICKDACNEGDKLTGKVCGRDGIEYMSLCHLKMKSCKGPAVKVKRFGPCKEFDFMKGISCQNAKDMPTCKKLKRRGYCKTMKKRIAPYCPHECGFCAAKASKSPCHYTKFGCCIDARTPSKGPNYEGCPEEKKCEDKYPILCKRFNSACGEEANKQFMRMFCPATCFYCPKSI